MNNWMNRLRTATAAALWACVALATPTAHAALAPFTGYLLAHFTGESTYGEQVYLATSTDGLHWTDMNNSQPVLTSTVGEKGVRDLSVVRSPDGTKYWILGTDLRIASGKGWNVAEHSGSTKLVIWESTDLLHWSAPRLADVAGSIAGAGCAWAPEAIWDTDSNAYIVYWTTISTANGIDKPRIYYSKTTDFVTFTAAQVYIDRPGTQQIIDTQIIEVTGSVGGYRYVRASGDGQITLEGSQTILGDWKTIGDLRPVGLTGKQVEGPILYQLNDSGKWALWVDQYAAGKGYLALVSPDLSKAENFRILDANEYAMGKSTKRHGSILNISADEYRAVTTKWGKPQ